MPVLALGDLENIVPARFPQLRQLAWNRDEMRPISGAEAFGLYEAGWRHVDEAALCSDERALIRALADRFGGGHLLTTR